MNELGTWGIVADPYVPPAQGPKYVVPRCGCVTFGEGVPTSTDAGEGDVYIDSLTEIGYQFQNGTWTVFGGGGSTQVFSGHYAQGAPPFTPTASVAIAMDLDAPFETWIWSEGVWT